jgi:hypothetical protein
MRMDLIIYTEKMGCGWNRLRIMSNDSFDINGFEP